VSARPRVLITGASGQLGRELVESFAADSEVIACDRNSLDLSLPEQIRAKVRDVAPDVILNAGAYTAVDRAETEEESARAINADAPGVLAEEALRTRSLLVHYSTDYVFSGSKSGSWTEDDATGPLNVYGVTKLAGEEAIRKAGGRYLIFRTSWVYGPHGKNFLLTMLRLGKERDTLNVVDDQIGAPTTSIELARATHAIANGVLAGQFSAEDRSGVYNMSCAGAVSWCGFAKAIFERAPQLLEGRMPQVNAIPTSAFPTPAKRPQNSILSNEKLFERFGVRLASWESALEDVLKKIATPRA
jgi:dTDP-4-dehydrorhamnose reductase